MGSSSRKKAKKKEDFQKPKLKVGKARPKATNFTDTSFRAKTIAVPSQQSLQTTAPSEAAQLKTHLSLLGSRSADQRSEHLQAFATLLTNFTTRGDPLPISSVEILHRVRDLILDSSNNVRKQLVRILLLLPPESIADAAPDLLLRIRAGITHISPDIRSSSMALLNVLIDVAPLSSITCPGGFIKTLKTLYTALGWPVPDISDGKNHASRSGWTNLTTTAQASVYKDSLSVSKSAAGMSGTAQTRTKFMLGVLAKFLRHAILPCNNMNPAPSSRIYHFVFPLRSGPAHVLPIQPHAFTSLSLFGAPKDIDGESFEFLRRRQKIFLDLRLDRPIATALPNLRQEGGDLGRAAGELGKVLTTFAADLEAHQSK